MGKIIVVLLFLSSCSTAKFSVQNIEKSDTDSTKFSYSVMSINRVAEKSGIEFIDTNKVFRIGDIIKIKKNKLR